MMGLERNQTILNVHLDGNRGLMHLSQKKNELQRDEPSNVIVLTRLGGPGYAQGAAASRRRASDDGGEMT